MDDLGGTPILGNLYLSFLRPVFFFWHIFNKGKNIWDISI